MRDSSCSGIHRKLICGSSFCNVGGCLTQISMKLSYTRELYSSSLRRAILQKAAFKVTNKVKPLRMFSLACNLLRIDPYSNDLLKTLLAKKPVTATR